MVVVTKHCSPEARMTFPNSKHQTSSAHTFTYIERMTSKKELAKGQPRRDEDMSSHKSSTILVSFNPGR